VPEKSAGLLLYRRRGGDLEILLVHPGGPFWARKDDGAWSIPKGLYEDGEDPLLAAQREFAEEVGTRVEGAFLPLGEFKLSSGKRLSVWAIEGDLDAAAITSNLFEMDWPPRSGKRAQFPEVDRGEWFTPEAARIKVTKGQLPVIDAFVGVFTPPR
jgi:predicted NUDIX family NTP pyrophosphohydrolase